MREKYRGIRAFFAVCDIIPTKKTNIKTPNAGF